MNKFRAQYLLRCFSIDLKYIVSSVDVGLFFFDEETFADFAESHKAYCGVQ